MNHRDGKRDEKEKEKDLLIQNVDDFL